MRLQLAFH